MSEVSVILKDEINLKEVLGDITSILGEFSSAYHLVLNPDNSLFSKKYYPMEWIDENSSVNNPELRLNTALIKSNLKPDFENHTKEETIQEPLSDLCFIKGYGVHQKKVVFTFLILRSNPFSKSELQQFNSIVNHLAFILYSYSTLEKSLNETNAETSTLKTIYSKDIVNAIKDGTSLKSFTENAISSLVTELKASTGVCFFYENKTPYSDGKQDLELSDSVYIDDKFETGSDNSDRTNVPILFEWCLKNEEPIIIPRAGNDDNNYWWLPSEYVSKPCLLMPIPSLGLNKIGVLVVLFEKSLDISEGLLDIAGRFALQISIFHNKLTQNVTHRKETPESSSSINVLYRLSHELSSLLTTEEVFQRAFEIMEEELEIERFWLGLLNETSSRIIGQAAYGPGLKKKIIDLNLDIRGQNNLFSEVLEKKSPLLIKNVKNKGIPGIGLKRFILKNNINAIGLVPIVAGGQVLGILAFEGEPDGCEINNSKLSLLLKFCSEIGNILLSKRLEERVAAGETMRAAGLLAAGIAHNFNNVLQGILGQASLLELYAKKPEQVQKAAEQISNAANKGAKLVKQLLSFAYLEEPRQEVFEIPALISQNQTLFQRVLKGKQYIRYAISDSVHSAYADPSQVVRILTALLTNASEAMTDDGCVEIIVDEIQVNDSSPHYEVPYGKYVRIGVRDNGSGMDAETKKRCFEPFFTTKNVDPTSGLSLSGQGMGLSAAYTLARKNGGRLVVDSRMGHGSLFTLYLQIDPDIHTKPKEGRLSKPQSNINSRIEIEKSAEAPKDKSNMNYQKSDKANDDFEKAD